MYGPNLSAPLVKFRVSAATAAFGTFLGFSTLPMPSSAADWVPGPSFPTGGSARSHVAAVTVGGTIWALGGSPFDGAGDGATHSLASGASSWTVEPSQEGPILWHGAGIDGMNRIVVFGGQDSAGDQEGSNYVYNPLEGPEDGLPDRGDGAPLARFAYAVDDAGRLYTVGGGPGPDADGGDPNVGSGERYVAATDEWEAIAPVPYGVAEAALAPDGNGHLLLFGGIDATATTRLSTVAFFDLLNGTWSTSSVPPMPVALSGHKAVLGSDERIYVIGGESGPVGSPTTEARVWVLHLPTLTWSEGSSLATPRAHFGAVMGPGDTIYVLGGDQTETVETLYTAPCPTFENLPSERTCWSGETLVLAPVVAGGQPIQFQWRKNGLDLADGPSDGGGSILGAATSALRITDMTEADEGTYTLVATNECGTVESSAASVLVELPAEIHLGWQATSLHPTGALSSRADGVGDGQQAGTAVFPVADGTEDHAVLWTGTAGSAVDLHNPETIVTRAVATAGGIQAGNWYQPFEILHNGQWYTVYYPEGCAWSSTAGSFQNLNVSGWEYSVVRDTDGVRQIGTVSRDDEVGNVFSRAGMWSGTSASWVTLHPSQGVSNSFGVAFDGDQQYGTIHTPYPGPIQKAAKWSGTANSYEDMHPSGASRSWVSGAGDGQQVGTAEYATGLHPIVWSGHQLSAVDLSLSDGRRGTVTDASGGLQSGALTIDNASHAVVWATDGDDWVDLHAALPADYSYSRAEAIDVDENGVVWVAGYAHHSGLDRIEAFLWRSDGVPSDVAEDVTASGAGSQKPLPLHLGPNPATLATRLSLDASSPGRINVRVFDAAGRQRTGVSARTSDAGLQHVELGELLGTLPTGAYFIRVETEDGGRGTTSVRVVR